MEHLSSLKNPKVSLWRTLKDRKGRKDTGCFLVEGRKMAEEAFSSTYPIEAILVDEALLDTFALPAQHPVYTMPAHVLAAICDTKTPQGIAVVLKMQTAALPPQARKLIALDGVQDPGNVGTILRTADCAGLDGILLSEQCADIFSPKVLRATMGSIFRMPVMITQNLPDALMTLRKDGFPILSSQLDGEPFYQRSPIGDRFCLIVGNEGNGVSPAVQAVATHRLKLPMRGGAESLNAAVAAAIMMYDLTKEEA